MRYIATLSFLIAVLAGCERDVKPNPQLALACQTVKCTCTEQQKSIVKKPKTVPLLWRENGDAYCSAGYVLRATPDG